MKSTNLTILAIILAIVAVVLLCTGASAVFGLPVGALAYGLLNEARKLSYKANETNKN